MPVTLEVSYFNTFWLKRLKNFPGTTNGTTRDNGGDGYIEPNVNEAILLSVVEIPTAILSVLYVDDEDFLNQKANESPDTALSFGEIRYWV